MVVDQLDADAVFRALADRTRRDILVQAADGRHSVSDLASRYPMSFAAVQKHVAILERAGLVTKRPRGRKQLVSTNPETLRSAGELLEELARQWTVRIHQFEKVLGETLKEEE